MKITITHIFLFVLGWTSVFTHSHELQWLEGDWSRKSDNGTIVESWKKVNDHMLKGTSILKVNGQKTLIEELYLIKMKSGWFYIAKPVQNEFPTPFKQQKIKENQAHFENKNYDFPQKIEYQRQGSELHIMIEGTIKKQKKSFTFIYEKQ
ncbi:DUF6265 family protein [Candidatus Uabimicrobium sp. HlEnr_7]|uniref:DUF6265 family protein n=1 Tax=Candidatus Uabimicrobium helgolandensis TaxID=3095367 RepID=UPI003555F049